jgi:hypothetical protein
MCRVPLFFRRGHWRTRHQRTCSFRASIRIFNCPACSPSVLTQSSASIPFAALTRHGTKARRPKWASRRRADIWSLGGDRHIADAACACYMGKDHRGSLLCLVLSWFIGFLGKLVGVFREAKVLRPCRLLPTGTFFV